MKEIRLCTSASDSGIAHLLRDTLDDRSENVVDDVVASLQLVDHRLVGIPEETFHILFLALTM